MNLSNILLVEGRRTIGGGQIMSLRICNVLSKDYPLSVFIPSGNSPISNLLSNFTQYHYPLQEYKSGKKSVQDIIRLLTNTISCYRLLKRIIKQQNVQLIYVQAPALIPLVTLVAQNTHTRILVHLHVVHVDRKVRTLLNFCLHSKHIKQILGVSQYTLQQLSKRNSQKATVLYNYVDTFNKKNHSIEEKDKYTIAVIGDVMHIKGQHILFEALNHIPLNIELLVIGRVVEEDYYKKIIQQQYSFPYRFTGYTNDVNKYLDSSDLTVVSSSSSSFETFSLAMVESWAKGIPTIASAIGGMKELVFKFLPQYTDVMLFPVESSDCLRQNIQKLLSDSNLYQNISCSVEKVAHANFTEKVFEKRLLNIVQNCLIH